MLHGSVVALAKAEHIRIQRALAFSDHTRARVLVSALQRPPRPAVQADRFPRSTTLVDAHASVGTGATRSVREGVAHPFFDAVVGAIAIRIIVVGAEGTRVLRHARSGTVVATDLPVGAGRIATSAKIVNTVVVPAAPAQGSEEQQRGHRVGHGGTRRASLVPPANRPSIRRPVAFGPQKSESTECTVGLSLAVPALGIKGTRPSV